MADVVEDVVDDDTLEILRASTDELVRSSGVPVAGCAVVTRGPPSAPERGPQREP